MVDVAGGEIVEIKLAVVIVADIAREKYSATKLGDGDGGIGRRAATGAATQGEVVAQAGAELRLTLRIDQRHNPFGHSVTGEIAVVDFNLGIDQGVAKSIELVFFVHGVSPYRRLRYYAVDAVR